MEFPDLHGVYDYAGPPNSSRCRCWACGLPRWVQRRRPDCKFSKLDTQPILSPVYASLDTSQRPAQNSGPSGSLLLSREALSSSIPCRFIPAHAHTFINHLIDNQLIDGIKWRRAKVAQPRNPVDL